MSAIVYYVVQVEEASEWRDWTSPLTKEGEARAECELARAEYAHKGWRVVRRVFTENVLP